MEVLFIDMYGKMQQEIGNSGANCFPWNRKKDWSPLSQNKTPHQ